MACYRRPELSLSTRIELALELLTPRPQRQWGRVTELARQYGVSRTWLYRLRERVLQALTAALAPREPGPRPHPSTLVVNEALLRRAITVLPLLKGTVRDIQQGLALLFGVHRSVGFIQQTLQAVGAAAEAYQSRLSIPLPVLGEADEIFQGGRPCLTVVDGRSFLVLHLSPAAGRDRTTWGLTFLELQERGIRFQDLASDGAGGLRAGVHEAELAVPLRPDLFHLLRDAQRLSQSLERAAYRAIRVAERVRRAEREAQAPRRRRGRPLKVSLSRPEAEAQEAQAIAVYDSWVWLLAEVRQALEPITPDGCLQRVAPARATLEAAMALMQELDEPGINAFAHRLRTHLEELLAPLAWLEHTLAPWRAGLDAATERWIVRLWQQRQALGLSPEEAFPRRWLPVARAFWEALALFHRSSSLAESLHSWLRPYLHIHRGMPAWLLPLLQLFWNHHRFQRGQRAGKTPLELAGVRNAPSLAEVLDQLLNPQPAQALA